MQIRDILEVRQNLRLTLRDERGKLCGRREGHNIWLATGAEWLTRLMGLKAVDPDVPEENARIKYMGLGVGGNRQFAQARLAVAPYDVYAGTNAQTDQNPAVTRLERPVRVSGGEGAYPGVSTDRWLAAVQAPPDYPSARTVRYRRIFTRQEVSYGNFLSIPISEIGLFISSADPAFYLNTPVAYDTFDPLSKTSAVALEVTWDLEL